MKKALSLILSLLMVCSLAACGGGKTGESANTPNGEAPAQETKKVESMVYLTATTDNEYFINVAHGCQQFCEENGIKFEFMAAITMQPSSIPRWKTTWQRAWTPL